ncbi:WD repeat domain-containing protein 83 [Trichinella spiralis]|uniref:WD repeat domain-containing protein 83 n=2 Tax=Trichinella spiralis TaxID=6334 RepID=A0A0V1AW30_TRISP|nr:WD repeat domain-containing protein 83 [Trichinella spiralis]
MQQLAATINCKQSAIRAVRFNVDGGYCMTCGSDKTVKLWNPHRGDSGLLLKTYAGHGYEVLDARSSHDNAQIASSGSDKQVLLWDVGSGRIVRKFRGHAERRISEGSVNAVAFNNESSVLMSASLDCTILDEARDSVLSVTVSDHEILTGSADCRTRRYDLRKGMLYEDFVGKSVSSVNFSRDGQCTLISSLDSTVRLLEKDSGQLLAQFTGHKNNEYKMDSCFLSSDRQIISGSEDGKLFCWDLLTGNLLYILNHPVPFVVSSRLDGDRKSNRIRTTIDFSHPDLLRNQKLISNGKVVFVCDQYLSVWSPVFRRLFSNGPKDQGYLVNVHYDQLVDFLLTIYPTQKQLTESNLKPMLNLANEFDVEGLREKCMEFMRNCSKLSLMEQLELADRYHLEPLTSELIVRLASQRRRRPAECESAQYAHISDRTKVRLLEAIYNGVADHSHVLVNRPKTRDRLERFKLKSELNFAKLHTLGQCCYFVNPYYLAAWSDQILQTLATTGTAGSVDQLTVSMTDDETAQFLLAVHPPLVTIEDHNVSQLLKAACTTRSSGLMRSTVDYVLHGSSTLFVGEKLYMLDRCLLYDLMPIALLAVDDPQQLLDLITRAVYNTLGVQTKACILDRLASLLRPAANRLQNVSRTTPDS